MDRRIPACVCTLLLLLSACGGGGGGAGPAAPPVTPPVVLVTPPSIDGTALRLAQLPGACSTHDCVQLRRLLLAAGGEYIAVWEERPAAGTAALHAANADATGILSQASVDAAYNNVQDGFVEAGARRLLYLYQSSPVPRGAPLPAPPPGGYSTTTRLVTFGSTGSAVVSSAVVAPAVLQPAAPIVRDLAGNLSVIVAGTTAPFPIATLAGNTQVSLLTPAASPYAEVDLQVFADFDSIAPRALQATLGKAASGDKLAIYVDQLSLADGALFGGQVSSQEVRRTDVGATRVCSPQPRLVSTANAAFAVSWVQLNAAGNGCDLVVNGTAINRSGVDVLQSAVAGGIGVYSAVWQESDAGNLGMSRLRFAQLGPTAGTPWTTPAAIDATYGNAPMQTVLAMARGPDNTLAVVWEPCEGTAGACTTSVRLVSKFVGGTWTTKSIGRSLLIAGVAIDAAGEGVLLAVGESCSGGACTELWAYRF